MRCHIIIHIVKESEKAMKRIFICLIVSLVFITGCSNKFNSSNENATTDEQISISELAVNSSKFENEIERAKYENIVLTDTFSVNIPNTESVFTFTLNQKTNLASEDIKKYLDNIIPGIIDEQVNLETDLRFISDSIQRNSSLSYPDSLPLLSDYLNQDIKDINTYVLGCCDYYLELKPYGSMHILNDGKAQSLDKIESECAGIYFATDNHEIEKKYNNSDYNDEYKLLDKKISINNCAANVEKYISDNLSFNSNEELKPAVCAAKAIEMDDDLYGLSFNVTCLYKGVQFDTYRTDTDGSFTEISNSKQDRKNYNLMPGVAFVLSSDKINNYNDYERNYDIDDTKEYTKIISPVEAMKICSASLSSNVPFEVSSCELKYLSYYTNEEETNLSVYPVWRIQSLNTNDNLNYVMYVNAINKEFDYYTY